MPSVILLNIGNSFTDIVVCRDGELGERERQVTAELLELSWESRLLESNPGLPLVGACVVPAARQRLHETFTTMPQTWLSAELPIGLDFSRVDSSTVGADRIANAVAATELLELPAIVLDCGTAITIEVVDREARFLGGAILPGRRLARRALNTGTAQLPDIPFSVELPDALGTTTQGAILAGIDRGLVGAIDRLLADTAEAIGGQGLPAVVVGGDAPYFAEHLAHATMGPADFTLRGLAMAAGRLGLG